MKTKICTKCGDKKEFSEFSPTKLGKFQLSSSCRECVNKYKRERRKTKTGLITTIYENQIGHSRHRNHPLPVYTKQQLIDWVYSQPLFHKLYDNWVKSSYDKNLTPSCDRVKNNLPYTLVNIKLMTWKENRENYYKDKLKGINNEEMRAVIGVHKVTGEVVEFNSLSQAARSTNTAAGNICKCCNNHRRYSHVGGYKWKYKK